MMGLLEGWGSPDVVAMTLCVANQNLRSDVVARGYTLDVVSSDVANLMLMLLVGVANLMLLR